MCNIPTFNLYKNIMQRKEKILLVSNINNACICELSKAMCNNVKFNAVLMFVSVNCYQLIDVS